MDLNQINEEKFTDEEMSEVDRLQSDPSSEYYYNDPDIEEGFLDKIKRKLEPYGEDFKGFIEYLLTPSRHFGTGQYNEGGVAEQMEMFGYTAEGAQQEADKFVGEAGNLEEDISKAASFIVPFYDSGVNIANVAQEYMKPEQERDYDYIKSQFTEAGQSAAIEGGLLLMGGVAGKYGAKGIKALADKVKQYEIDPTAMSSFGAGSIRIKPKKTKPFKLDDMYRDDFDWGRLNLTDSQVAELANVEKSVLAAGGGQKAVEAAEKRVQDAIDARIPVIAEALKYKLKTSDKGVVSLDAYKDAVEATVRFDTIEEAAESISNQRGILNKMGPGMMDNMLWDDRSMTAFEQLPDNETFQYIFDEGLDRALVDWAVKEEAIRKSYNKYRKAANKNIRTFNKGGEVMDDQMKMAFMDEGGIADDGMDVDPVSGNEVPPGSLAEEVRDDIPAQLSEGEYVVPADVVRYYGVKFFEDLRDQAKMGLADMEANGRIGGEPVPAGGPINDSELSPQEMQAIQEMMGANMNEGGQVQNPYLQQQQLYSQPRPAPIDEKRNTTLTNINPNPVENQMPMQSMASGGQVQGYQPGGPVTPVTPAQDQMMYAQNPFDPFNYGAGYSFMGGQPQQQPPVADTPAIPESMTLYGPNGEIRMFTMPLSEADTAEVARLITEGYSKTKAVTPPTIGGNGGGVNIRPPVPKPDPNAWAENITDPVAWADENLGKKDDGIIKLGQSVARTRALAIIAEAEGNDKLAEVLRGKARKVVENNKALQFVPEGGINGTSTASALQKDKDYKNIVDRIFKTKKSDSTSSPLVQTKKQKNKANIAASKKQASKGTSSGRAKAIIKAKASGISTDTARKLSGAQMIAGSDVGAGPGGSDITGPMNKGGLMKKKGKK